MTRTRMLEIAKEEQKRFLMLKSSCDSCIPDELVEWIDEVIKLLDIKINSCYKKVEPSFIENLCEKYPCEYKDNEKIDCYCENEDGTFTVCLNKFSHCNTEDFKTIIGLILYLNTLVAPENCHDVDEYYYDSIKAN